MTQETILVIENDSDLRESLKTALSAAKLNVITAENGAVGVKKAIEHKPDVILLDIIMPEMTGHEVLDTIRSDPWGKDAKIIMLTSLSSAGDIMHAVENDTEDYIIKSHTSLSDIVKKVREVMVM